MKYLIFRRIKNNTFQKIQGEINPILRYDVPPFNDFEDAVAFIREECLKTFYCLDDFRILAEQEEIEDDKTKSN